MSFNSRAFTLIELLIVVAIIAILAAIAVPNFIEAQTRAKVSRVQSDLRTLANALEAYYVDNNNYPEGTDDPAKYDPNYATFFGSLARGYYTFATRHPSGGIAGRDFGTITTPVAYITSILYDPFASHVGGNVTYAYRNAKDFKNGWILTSFGPDADVLSPGGRGSNNVANPLSTAADTNNPARLGDINERDVIRYMENGTAVINAVNAYAGSLRRTLDDLTYDPTNGSISEGDIYRLGGSF